MDLRRRLMANNVGSALSTLLTSGQTFYAPFADKGSGEVSLVAAGAGASQSPTFTRATTATTVNSAGLIVSVASGTPRSYYDPTTLAYRGYLAEGARTNLCLYSQDFSNAAWQNNNITLGGFITAPDGTSTLQLATNNSVSAGYFRETTGRTSTGGQSVTLSSFFKAGTAPYYQIGVSDLGTNYAFASIDTSSLVIDETQVSGTGSIIDSSVKEFPNGIYRFQITIRYSNALTYYGYSAFTSSVSPLSTIQNQTGYAWGYQIEAGAFASSYIPTTTASVVRNADVLTYPFSGNASATVGSAYAIASSLWTVAPSTPTSIVQFGSNGQILVVGGGASTTLRFFDGTNVTDKAGLSDLSTGVRKRASTWGGSTTAITGDGVAVTAGTFDGTVSSTAIGIGVNPDTSTAQWFGTIRNVRIYQNQFTSAQLQAVTA